MNIINDLIREAKTTDTSAVAAASQGDFSVELRPDEQSIEVKDQQTDTVRAVQLSDDSFSVKPRADGGELNEHGVVALSRLVTDPQLLYRALKTCTYHPSVFPVENPGKEYDDTPYVVGVENDTVEVTYKPPKKRDTENLPAAQLYPV